MKTITFFLILLITGSGLLAQTPPNLRQLPRRPVAPAQTPAMPAPIMPTPAATAQNNNSSEEMIPPGLIDFQGVDVSQVLEVYAQLVGRTLLRAGLPQASIVLKTETPLTKTEAIQALQAVLALNGIAVINVGDKFVKVLPVDQANTAGAPINDMPESQLPELGSYVTRIVQLKYVKPSEMVPIIQPFAKLANSILPIDSNGILVLRDDAENVKRMLEMIAKVDVAVPAEYISDVIPIKYAMVDDIANALNSLSGSGSGTVAVGSSTTPGAPNAANGIVRPNGNTGMNGGGNGMGIQNGNNSLNRNGSTFGSQNRSSTGTSPFASRLSAIMNHIQQGGGGGQEEPIQIIGQTKIIADERSNSLLVYATRADLETIKDIVSKLDVLLAQVLIESVIMDVSMGKGWNFGVSVAQNQINAGQNQSIKTIGGFNNGQPFYNFLQNATSNSFPGNLTSTLPGSGLSYFGDLGPNWDVALNAAANDNSVTVIQRPRIQTSQAKEAQFFVGSTVPYVTSVYYDSGIGGGPSSSYSQLQVGISLDVTPFINPDGLVVMDINQEIDDISGSVSVQGVGDVPTTDKRTLSSEIAVKDKDTIILGGFVRDDKTKSRSGVPLLEDIPFIGNLFSSRTSQKDRDELIVLMRPTVLRTPDIAAEQTLKEKAKLPGVSEAEQENLMDERKAEAAALKREHIEAQRDGDFISTSPGDQMMTNMPTVQ